MPSRVPKGEQSRSRSKEILPAVLIGLMLGGVNFTLIMFNAAEIDRMMGTVIGSIMEMFHG